MVRLHNSSFRYSGGFTIVELLVVIVVIGILGALTFVGYNGVSKKTKETAIIANMKNCQKTLSIYNAENGTSPASLDLLGPANNLCTKTVLGNDFTYKQDPIDNKSYSLIVTDYNLGESFIATDSMTPTMMTGWKQISATSGGHACGIATNGRAYCWGSNNNGQVGNKSSSTANVPTPVAVYDGGALSGLTIKSITTGTSHTCAIASNDKAYCWGNNGSGVLGNNTTTSSNYPVAVKNSSNNDFMAVKSISTSYLHTCAIAIDDQAYCWGSYLSGRLGNGQTSGIIRVPSPVLDSGGGWFKKVKSISTGSGHTCAIAFDDSKAYCWGSNDNGQLGFGSITPSSQSYPTPVLSSNELAGKTIKQISTGSVNSCAIASDNMAYCWGTNTSGQRGTVQAIYNSSYPTVVDNTGVMADSLFRSIASGSSFTCGISADNRAFCWGYNSAGQVGDGTNGLNRAQPVAVSNVGWSVASSISTGGSESCAVTYTTVSDIKGYCWGQNTYQGVGNGLTGYQVSPQLVTFPY